MGHPWTYPGEISETSKMKILKILSKEEEMAFAYEKNWELAWTPVFLSAVKGS